MIENKPGQAQRLNPFALPPETNTRFSLLIATAFILTLNIVMLMVEILWLEQIDTLSIPVIIEVEALQIGFAFVTLLVAVVIYRTHPARIRRNNKLLTVSRDKDVKFFVGIQELVKLSGVSETPSIQMASDSKSVDGQAFGLPGHYYLRLGGRMPLLLRQKAGNFRAIILHELAHIVNGDIGRTYFAGGLWLATIFITIIPAAILISLQFTRGLVDKLAGGINTDELRPLLTLSLPTFLILFFQLGGTLAVIAAIRSSLLRVREFYADWRAALWGAGAALADILNSHTASQKTGSFLSRIFGVHPAARERLAGLEDPGRLFRIKSEVALFVGISLGLILDGVVFFANNFMLPIAVGVEGAASAMIIWISSLHSSKLLLLILILSVAIFLFLAMVGVVLVLAALGVGMVYFVAGAIGVDVQRETLSDMSMARQGWSPYLSLWKPAALLAIGFQLGLLLSPINYLAGMPGLIQNLSGLIVTLIILLRILVSMIATTCLTWLWMIYARFFAARTLGAHVGRTVPNLAQRVFTLALGVLLLLLYLPVIVEYLLVYWMTTNGVSYAITYALWNLLLVVGVLFLYCAIFGVSWVIVQVRRVFVPSHCPACGRITHRKYAVGQVCESCGSQLAPWLFVN